MDFWRAHSVLLALLVAAVLVTLAMSPSPLMFTMYFFAVPAAYLVYRKPSIFLPSLCAAVLFGLIYGVSFDYIVEISGEWIFPRSFEFYAPNWYLGVVSGDVLNWFFWWVFIVVVYHESFVDRANKALHQYVHLKKFLVALMLGLIPLVAIHFLRLDAIVPYSYFVLGICALIPVAVLALRRRFNLIRLLRSVPYLFLLFLAMEVVALMYGYWDFTGEYVAAIRLVGTQLPFEELVFWIIGSPIILIAYHELFLDDER